MATLAVVQIERRFAWDVQQGYVFLLAFYSAVRVAQGVFKIVRHVFIKRLVLVLSDVVFIACPQSRSSVNRFVFVGRHLGTVFPFRFLHDDGQGNVVGVFADNGFKFPVA